MDEKEEVMRLGVDYFTSLLGQEDSEVQPLQWRNSRIIPYCFPQAWKTEFVATPTAEETKEIIFAMPNRKAPGPDGFPVEYFWEASSICGL